MKRTIWTAAAWSTLVALLSIPIRAQAEIHPIDAQKSMLTVRVYKSGLFAIFAHDHEIRTPIARGELDDSDNPWVELWVDAASLQVVDSEISAKDRVEVQKTMEGPEVLDIRRFPKIHFRSTTVQKTRESHWTVRGDLALHGQTRPVSVEVSGTGGHYQGSATLKQRDFGINPVSIAGGTVKVKDEVKIEFEVTTAR